MKTVILTGRLAKKFGKKFELDIASPAEAVRALSYLISGFEDEIRKGYYRVIRVFDTGRQIGYSENDLTFYMGRAHTLRIEPVAQGAKSGLFNIVIGAALVGAAFLLTGGALAGTAFTLFGQAITGTQLALVGGLMAISGVSSMLAPQFEEPANETKEKSSAMISTPSNRVEEGHCVPLVYGRDVFVGSVVIANAVNVEEFDDGE